MDGMDLKLTYSLTEDLATADSTPAPTSNLKVIDTTAPSVPSASEGLVPKSQDPTVPAVNASTSKSTDAKLVKELPARPTEVFEAGPGEVTNDTKTEIEGSTTTGTTKSIDETAALASATAGVGSMSLDKESVGTGVIKGRESGNPSSKPPRPYLGSVKERVWIRANAEQPSQRPPASKASRSRPRLLL